MNQRKVLPASIGGLLKQTGGERSAVRIRRHDPLSIDDAKSGDRGQRDPFNSRTYSTIIRRRSHSTSLGNPAVCNQGRIARRGAGDQPGSPQPNRKVPQVQHSTAAQFGPRSFGSATFDSSRRANQNNLDPESRYFTQHGQLFPHTWQSHWRRLDPVWFTPADAIALSLIRT